MKTNNNSKSIELSFEEFYSLTVKGVYGQNLQEHSVNSYLSTIRNALTKYQISEWDFLNYFPEDIQALQELAEDDQTWNKTFKCTTFNAVGSALKCYYNYANFKHHGIIVNGRKRNRRESITQHVRMKHKSFLWKILNIFGLIKFL